MKLILPAICKKYTFLKSIFFIVLVFSFFLLSFFAFPVHAVTTQSISAYPTYSTDTDPRSKSWFIYSLPAGVKKTDSVTVVNNGKEPLTLQVYAVDSTKANDGSFALANQEAQKQEVGAWVTMSAKEVTLNAGERKNISFTIAVPANASVGDHSGGIIFQMAPKKQTTTKGMAINVVSRVGVRIYETVPSADQLNMSVNNLHFSIVDNHLAISFTVENNGTVHVSPTGTLEIKDMFGRTADKVVLDSQLGVVLPGKPMSFAIPTNVLSPVFGWETATVAIYYSPTKAAVASIVVMPSPWAAFVLAFIIFLFVTLLILRKHLVKFKGKENKMVLAPHVWVIVGAILLGTIAFSALIAFLLNYFL